MNPHPPPWHGPCEGACVNFSHQRTAGESALEYGRGIAGGMIFALPLLYTMEVWWSGFLLSPGRLLLYVGCTFALLLLYNRFAGLRQDATFAEVAIDSVEEMGIGLVAAAGMLCLAGQLDPDDGLYGNTGKIVMEAMTVAIGVSVGSAQLGDDQCEDEGMADDTAGGEDGYLPQAAVALCAAVLFAANIAATDEVSIIAMESSPGSLLLLACVSMIVADWVLRYSGMHGSSRHVKNGSRFERFRGVITSYAVALFASGTGLFFFGRLDDQPAEQIVAMCVVAGAPAALGASAGRLLLQSKSPD